MQLKRSSALSRIAPYAMRALSTGVSYKSAIRFLPKDTLLDVYPQVDVSIAKSAFDNTLAKNLVMLKPKIIVKVGAHGDKHHNDVSVSMFGDLRATNTKLNGGDHLCFPRSHLKFGSLPKIGFKLFTIATGESCYRSAGEQFKTDFSSFWGEKNSRLKAHVDKKTKDATAPAGKLLLALIARTTGRRIKYRAGIYSTLEASELPKFYKKRLTLMESCTSGKVLLDKFHKFASKACSRSLTRGSSAKCSSVTFQGGGAARRAHTRHLRAANSFS